MKKETRVKISKVVIAIYLVVCVGLIVYAYLTDPVAALICTAGTIFMVVLMWSGWTLGVNSVGTVKKPVETLATEADVKRLWDEKVIKEMMDNYHRERVELLKCRVLTRLYELKDIYGIILERVPTMEELDERRANIS